MNPLGRAWRRQKAVNRARRIRAFRRGRAKLPCYKCGYDCYGVAGDACPECSAELRRQDWWHDGRWSVAWLTMLNMGCPVFLIKGVEISLRIPNGVGFAIPLFGCAVLPGLIGYLSQQRVRSKKNMQRRFLFVQPPFWISMLWLSVLMPLEIAVIMLFP